MVITSHTFYFLVETFMGISLNLFQYKPILYTGYSESSFFQTISSSFWFELIGWSPLDSSLYFHLISANKALFTPSQLPSFWLSQVYMKGNFYASCDLIKAILELGYFDEIFCPTTLDGYLIQYISLNHGGDSWDSYFRVVPSHGSRREWGWFRVNSHWLDQVELDQVEFGAQNPVTLDKFLAQTLADNYNAL